MFLFCLQSSMSGQGRQYCFEDFLYSLCYTLLPDNKFEYEELMCVAQIVGQGNYVENNDSIIFYYDSIDYFSHPIEIEKIGAASKKLYLKLNVSDYDTKEQIDTIFKNEITLQFS